MANVAAVQAAAAEVTTQVVQATTQVVQASIYRELWLILSIILCGFVGWHLSRWTSVQLLAKGAEAKAKAKGKDLDASDDATDDKTDEAQEEKEITPPEVQSLDEEVEEEEEEDEAEDEIQAATEDEQEDEEEDEEAEVEPAAPVTAVDSSLEDTKMANAEQTAKDALVKVQSKEEEELVLQQLACDVLLRAMRSPEGQEALNEMTNEADSSLANTLTNPADDDDDCLEDESNARPAPTWTDEEVKLVRERQQKGQQQPRPEATQANTLQHPDDVASVEESADHVAISGIKEAVQLAHGGEYRAARQQIITTCRALQQLDMSTPEHLDAYTLFIERAEKIDGWMRDREMKEQEERNVVLQHQQASVEQSVVKESEKPVEQDAGSPAAKVVVKFPDEKGAKQQQKSSDKKKSSGRKGKTIPSQKAKFCMYHLQGVCRNKSDACVFAHSLEEMHEARGGKASKNASDTAAPLPTAAQLAAAEASNWSPPQPMFVDIQQLGADFGDAMNDSDSDSDKQDEKQIAAPRGPPGLTLCPPPGLGGDSVSERLDQ